MSGIYNICKCKTQHEALSDNLYCNLSASNINSFYAKMYIPNQNKYFIANIVNNNEIKTGTIACSAKLRKFMNLKLDDNIVIQPYSDNVQNIIQYINGGSHIVEVDMTSSTITRVS